MPQAQRQILIAVSGMFQPLYVIHKRRRYTGMLAISCINDAVSSQKEKVKVAHRLMKYLYYERLRAHPFRGALHGTA
ncbi:hypothetical protein LNO88_18880 [Klebsiella pneumoniae subsp. pneumoniae]|nr:hypothetical protein [Klebsiella pneumoniae subsp. pneumoniae]